MLRRGLLLVPCLFVCGLASSSLAQEEAHPAGTGASAPDAAATSRPPRPERPRPKSLQELLDMVRAGFTVERAEDKRREEEFLQARDQQQRLLEEALAAVAREETLSQSLETAFNGNETVLADLEERLTARLGEMGELFGVVRLVSNDLNGQVLDSLTSSEIGERDELLDRLGRSKELPSTEDLEKLWFELQREMIEQGRVVRYRAPVLTLAGTEEEREVVRAGVFSAVSNGKYLLWDSRDQRLRELERQPPSRYLNTVAPFESGSDGLRRLAVDPSRGSLLSALTDMPSPTERIQQGGYVGYVIIALGLLALAVGLWRWLVITTTRRRVAAQRKSGRPDTGNPLGRVLQVYEANRGADVETLELKLDEAVLRESSRIESFLWLVKTVSVVAPLLGLLGTVTGMIQTFQAITLFGAGDPKMMAGGISEALVTTMLGLTIAIPLVLLSDTLSNGTQRILDVLDEQSAGLVALRSEDTDAGD